MTGTGRCRASIAVQRRIEWSDTDASGHYHHADALRLVEAAETALLDRLGLRDRIGCLPRVHLSVGFHRPLLFGDVVTIEVAVAKLGHSTRGGYSCPTTTACSSAARNGPPHPAARSA